MTQTPRPATMERLTEIQLQIIRLRRQMGRRCRPIDTDRYIALAAERDVVLSTLTVEAS